MVSSNIESHRDIEEIFKQVLAMTPTELRTIEIDSDVQEAFDIFEKIDNVVQRNSNIMKERIEVQKEFSIIDCENNPTKYYIFGDNEIHQGCGGQAIIRYCKNAFGIPTKKLPSMEPEAFFSDKPQEIRKVSMRLATLINFYESEDKPTLVFPLDGIGTGRAELKEHSPKIYEIIKECFENYFGLNIMP